MAPLRYAAKFDPFLSLEGGERGGAIQGKEGIKFCYLATLTCTSGAAGAAARARADKLLGDPDGLDCLGEDEQIGAGLEAHRQRVQVRHLVRG